MNPRNQFNDSSRGGFTIIEVVLVLAIAGLIFLMVFIALPALQRSQRDTQRRDDMAKVSTAVTQYQTNNNGKVPRSQDNINTLLANYLKKSGNTTAEFNDPDGEEYSIKYRTDVPTSLTFGDHQIQYIYKGHCDGETASTSGGKNNEYAIMYALEGSGTYCEDNSN